LTAPPLIAAISAVCAVAALWNALAVVEHARVLTAIRRVIEPLYPAGPRGLPGTRPDRVRLIAMIVTTLFAAGWLLDGLAFAVLCAAVGPMLPARIFAWRRRRWTAALAGGAPVAARSIADALGGGQSIRGAIAEAARVGGAGAASDAELRGCAAALGLGASTTAALDALRQRAGCAAWDTLVAAILLNRDAGGDLAGLLRDLAQDLESSRRVEADARAATAQARFTGWMVAALPAVGALLTELTAPGTLAQIFAQPLALLMAGAALVLQLLGIAAIHRLASP
jgi:tight adherence protein B